MAWLSGWDRRRSFSLYSADTITSAIARVAVTSTTPDSWLASTTIFTGALVMGGGLVHQCTAGGTTGSSEPTWATTHGGTTSDNTVTWTCRKDIIVADGCNADFSDIRFTTSNGSTAAKAFTLGQWWDDTPTWKRLNKKLSTVVYLADGTIIGGTTYEVVRSTDGGATWSTLKSFSSDSSQVRGLHVHSSGRIFASPYKPTSTGLADAGLWMSDTNGENWTQVTSGAFSTYPIPAKSSCWSIVEDSAGNVYTADYGPYDNSVLRKGTYSSGTFTWSILGRWRDTTAAADATNDKFVVTSSVQTVHNHYITIDPFQSEKIYIGFGDGLNAGQNTYYSADGGSSWTAMGSSFGQYTNVICGASSRVFLPDTGTWYATSNDSTVATPSTDGTAKTSSYSFDGRYYSNKFIMAFFADLIVSYDQGNSYNVLNTLTNKTTTYHGIRQISDVRSGLFYASISTGINTNDFDPDYAAKVNLHGLRTYWINVGDVAASGTATLYCYYGNSGASESIDITCFPVGDHFEGSSIDTTTMWDLKESSLHPIADDDIVATVSGSKLRWTIGGGASSLAYTVSRHIKSKTLFNSSHHVYFLPTAVNQQGSNANVNAYAGIVANENTDGYPAEAAVLRYGGDAAVYNATLNASYTNTLLAAWRPAAFKSMNSPRRVEFLSGTSSTSIAYPGMAASSANTTNLPDGTPNWGIGFGINHGGATTTGDGVYLELDYLFAVPVYTTNLVGSGVGNEESSVNPGIISFFCIGRF